jgi:hypothetical protein
VLLHIWRVSLLFIFERHPLPALIPIKVTARVVQCTRACVSLVLRCACWLAYLYLCVGKVRRSMSALPRSVRGSHPGCLAATVQMPL